MPEHPVEAEGPGGARPAATVASALPENALPSNPLEEMTAAAAKAARDYQSWMLQNMKASIGTALDHAVGLTSTKLPTDSTTRGPTSLTLARPEWNVAAAKAAEDYRARAFAFTKDNVNVILDYAQQLVNVGLPAEFVALSVNHASRQFELIVRQTAELGSLAQSLAQSNVELMTSGIPKAVGERKK